MERNKKEVLLQRKAASFDAQGYARNINIILQQMEQVFRKGKLNKSESIIGKDSFLYSYTIKDPDFGSIYAEKVVKRGPFISKQKYSAFVIICGGEMVCDNLGKYIYNRLDNLYESRRKAIFNGVSNNLLSISR